jgi:hypothetical protein
MDEILVQINKRFDEIDQSLDKGFDSFDKVFDKCNALLKWLIGLQIFALGEILVLIVKVFFFD